MTSKSLNWYGRGSLALLLSAGLAIVSCDGNGPTTPTNGPGPSGPTGPVSNTNSVAEESFSFQRNVQNATRLTLEGINGTVSVTGSAETRSATISGVRRVGSDSTADAQAHLQELQVQVTVQGNEILVTTIQPDDTQGRNYVVDYEIAVPQNLEVWVSNINGNLTSNDLAASTSVDLTNGRIESKATLPEDGTMELLTVNGSIVLDIPSNTSAQFSAQVTNGTIKISNLRLRDQVTTTTSLQGNLGDGRGTITLRTVNGNISVRGF